jgi:hypothetical protein
MVAMGGGPDLPTRAGSSKKELVFCALHWPEEQVANGIKALRKAFDDVEVVYCHSKVENGKESVDVSEGESVCFMVFLPLCYDEPRAWVSPIILGCNSVADALHVHFFSTLHHFDQSLITPTQKPSRRQNT